MDKIWIIAARRSYIQRNGNGPFEFGTYEPEPPYRRHKIGTATSLDVAMEGLGCESGDYVQEGERSSQ